MLDAKCPHCSGTGYTSFKRNCFVCERPIEAGQEFNMTSEAFPRRHHVGCSPNA